MRTVVADAFNAMIEVTSMSKTLLLVLALAPWTTPLFARTRRLPPRS